MNDRTDHSNTLDVVMFQLSMEEDAEIETVVENKIPVLDRANLTGSSISNRVQALLNEHATDDVDVDGYYTKIGQAFTGSLSLTNSFASDRSTDGASTSTIDVNIICDDPEQSLAKKNEMANDTSINQSNRNGNDDNGHSSVGSTTKNRNYSTNCTTSKSCIKPQETAKSPSPFSSKDMANDSGSSTSSTCNSTKSTDSSFSHLLLYDDQAVTSSKTIQYKSFNEDGKNTTSLDTDSSPSVPDVVISTQRNQSTSNHIPTSSSKKAFFLSQRRRARLQETDSISFPCSYSNRSTVSYSSKVIDRDNGNVAKKTYDVELVAIATAADKTLNSHDDEEKARSPLISPLTTSSKSGTASPASKVEKMKESTRPYIASPVSSINSSRPSSADSQNSTSSKENRRQSTISQHTMKESFSLTPKPTGLETKYRRDTFTAVPKLPILSKKDTPSYPPNNVKRARDTPTPSTITNSRENLSQVSKPSKPIFHTPTAKKVVTTTPTRKRKEHIKPSSPIPIPPSKPQKTTNAHDRLYQLSKSKQAVGRQRRIEIEIRSHEKKAKKTPKQYGTISASQATNMYNRGMRQLISLEKRRMIAAHEKNEPYNSRLFGRKRGGDDDDSSSVTSNGTCGGHRRERAHQTLHYGHDSKKEPMNERGIRFSRRYSSRKKFVGISESEDFLQEY